MAITVYVFKRDDRTNYVCQWTDPTTGTVKQRSAKTANRREADKFAGQLQAKLDAGEDVETSRIEWSLVIENEDGEETPVGLADRYESEYLSGKATRTQYKFRAIRGHVERLINPKYANSLTSPKISWLQGELRKEGMEESTIKSSLSALRACLNWGKRMELLNKVPTFIMPTRVNEAKGRPLTFPEFKKYLETIEAPKSGFGECAHSLQDVVWGMWLSSLRLEECLSLTWDPSPSGISLEIDAKEIVRIRIESNSDKSTDVRLMPTPIDFQAFILSTPEAERHGYVFNPRVPSQRTERMRPDTLSKILSRVGELAQIQVAIYSPKEGETEPRIKYASAHDLRRSFADRWTDTVSEEHLMELMRHKDKNTTRKHYAKKRAERIEQALNEAMQRFSDTSSDILPFQRTG
jgi:integrase